MPANKQNAMKKIHDIRAENYEQTKDLSPAERSRQRTETARPIVEQYGFRVVSTCRGTPRLRKAKT